jgi:hypothetical protein
MRQVGSRIAGVSQIMRMQANSIISRSNSCWVNGRRFDIAMRRAADAWNSS